MTTRCSCRPGCLTWLRADDTTVATPAGPALVDHLTVVAYPHDIGPDVVFEASA